MAAIVDRSDPISIMSLTEELQRGKELDGIGGTAYLSTLSDGAITTPSHVRYCVERIRRAAGRRHIALTTQAIAAQASEPDANISELRERLIALELKAAEYEAVANTRIRTIDQIPDPFSLPCDSV